MTLSIKTSYTLLAILLYTATSCSSSDHYGCASGDFTLKGHLWNEAGKPLEKIKVYVTYPYDNEVIAGEPSDHSYYHATGQTNADGYFELHFYGPCNDNGTSELFKYGTFDPKGIYQDMDTIIGIKIIQGYRIRSIEFIIKEKKDK